jgi:16S rRNA (guanine1516-N2)-methyltransferase
MTPIVLVCDDSELNEAAQTLAASLSLDCVTQIPDDADLILSLTPEGLFLLKPQEKKMGALTVNFADGALTWRRNHGGGTGQAIAKAIGLKSKKNLSVLDATAGTGTDSFVLAALGCQVQMIERHPIVAALLQDALSRAQQMDEVYDITQNMSLHTGSAVEYMKAQDPDSFDVVYLDPMFPHSGKNAQVKKSMQYFRDMVGKDEDADDLLEPALNAAKYRVVVKRPRKSPYLMDRKPTLSHEGKANRFDIYVNQGMK